MTAQIQKMNMCRSYCCFAIALTGVVSRPGGDANGSGHPPETALTLTSRPETFGDAVDQLAFGFKGLKALVVLSNGEDSGSKETLNEAIDAAEHEVGIGRRGTGAAVAVRGGPRRCAGGSRSRWRTGSA